MGLFSNQFANVVEWEEYRDDLLFWKWTNREIKKDSRLIIKPGQDAIFLYNGAVEGIFTESGSYTIDSDIIPFLSTLKGFKLVSTQDFVQRFCSSIRKSLPVTGEPVHRSVYRLRDFRADFRYGQMVSFHSRLMITMC